MNAQAPADEIDKMFWREVNAASAGKAAGHAWVEFKHAPAGLVIEVNRVPALRIAIKYRDSGPYLCVEQAPGSNESMGSCIRTAGMVRHYATILEGHNALGEIIHASRAFVITDEERALVKMPDEANG